jgi:hypothetical protein
MLPDVEHMQMKAKGPHFSQQRIDQQLYQPLAPIGTQALAHQPEIILEFGSGSVSKSMVGGITAEAQARPDKTET